MRILFILIILSCSQATKAVNINTASSVELARELSGIGKVKAQRIVEYREKIGTFISIEQLTEIKGIGPKTLERNRDKIVFSTQSLNNINNNKHLNYKNPSLDLSPKLKKPYKRQDNSLWDVLVIIPLFIICLAIFGVAWLKNVRKDKAIPRKHFISSTFVCSGCGTVTESKNIYREGHFKHQSFDDHLPPGWTCIPNWLGKLCDYCFECSQKI